MATKSKKVTASKAAKVAPKAAAKVKKNGTATAKAAPVKVKKIIDELAKVGMPIVKAVNDGRVIDVELVKSWNLLIGKSRKR